MKKVPLGKMKVKAIKDLIVHRLTAEVVEEVTDKVVVEEPLEIRLRFFQQKRWRTKSLAVTMRTPGKDVALALGFLFSEGVIASEKVVKAICQLESN
ncbi:MAG: formate dehydrogenase accessory sulfurtransferase FdhD, partial [Bacteroidota bacterium]